MNSVRGRWTQFYCCGLTGNLSHFLPYHYHIYETMNDRYICSDLAIYCSQYISRSLKIISTKSTNFSCYMSILLESL